MRRRKPRNNYLAQKGASLNRFVIALLICSTSCLANDLLVNPDFENADMSAWVRTAISGIRPWGIGAADPYSGAKYVFTVDEASIQQSFSPVRGEDLKFLCFWADRPEAASLSLELFYSDSSSSGAIDLNSETSTGWNRVDVMGHIDKDRSLNGIKVTKLGTGTARLDNFLISTNPVAADGLHISADHNTLTISLGNVPPGSTNDLQLSTNLRSDSWQTVQSFVSSGTKTNLSHSLSTEFPSQFYRVITK